MLGIMVRNYFIRLGWSSNVQTLPKLVEYVDGLVNQKQARNASPCILFFDELDSIAHAVLVEVMQVV